jgi:Uma2 family endonuclease
MNQALRKLLTEYDYLDLENRSLTKSEFVYGVVHAMAGANERHNTITGNLFAACHAAKHGSPCRPFMGDMRLRLEGGELYYYPDIMLVCDPRDTDPVHKSLPCLLAEVSSTNTENIDRREKLSAYLKISSLREYLIVSQNEMYVELYQRQIGQDWNYFQLGAQESFTSVCLNLTLPLRQIYESIDF